MTAQISEKEREEIRLREVLAEIHKQKEEIFAKSGDIKQSVLHLRKDFWDDVTVNLENTDEMVETQASIRQQAELLSERERSHGQLHAQLSRLEQLEDSPYFGRIDFKEDGESREEIYIGRASLTDESGYDFLVYDWRAPISSMYYDFGLGPASFPTMDGDVEGNILLKRQYLIERGDLKGMFDTGITIGDQLLQRALGGQASTEMKSIVSTIQREQNKVIRHERKKFLVVQGVAGSGKTSAALQRVAYLLYRHRGTLNEKNMLLFSPNELFTSYVSEVLPELGEENIQQTTFMKFVDRNIKELKVESPFEQMEYVLTQEGDGNYAVRRDHIAFKSSAQYKGILDEYLEWLQDQGLIFKDLVFRDEPLVRAEEMASFYASLNKELPIINKVNLLTSWLKDGLEELKEKELFEDWVSEELELLDDDVITEAYHKLQEEDEMEDFYDSGAEERYLRERIVEEKVQPLIESVEELTYMDLIATYKKLLTDWSPKGELPDNWGALCLFALEQMDQGWLTWEEATAFSYFSDEIIGSSANRSIRHIIIDEAQDYTAFQMAYLTHIFPYTNFTLLGDINQAIYVETEADNPLSKLAGERVERITLRKSYRSTKEIVQFTKGFAPAGDMIETFERQGNLPKLLQTNKVKQVDLVRREIQEFLHEGHETIGLVCKTKAEADYLQRELSPLIDTVQVDERSKEFTKGVSILPIYLAKGIEFDAVLIPDASKDVYREEDRTLFYTACTRAMHELTIINPGEWTFFLEEADPKSYEEGS